MDFKFNIEEPLHDFELSAIKKEILLYKNRWSFLAINLHSLMHDYPDVIQPAIFQTDNFQFSNATSILIYLVGDIGENSLD